MSLKRHRPDQRRPIKPVLISYEGQVFELGEPFMFMSGDRGRRRYRGKTVHPWRLTPRQHRRIIEHTKGYAPVAAGWRHRRRGRKT